MLFRRHLRDVGLKHAERANPRCRVWLTVSKLKSPCTNSHHAVALVATTWTVRLMVDAGVLEQILIERDRAHYRISTGDGSTTLIDPES